MQAGTARGSFNTGALRVGAFPRGYPSRDSALPGGTAAVAAWRPPRTLRKEPAMATSTSQVRQFLHQATIASADTDAA